MIEVPGFTDARDLGGLPTLDTAATLPGRVVRAEVPSVLDADQAAALEEVGLTLVVDLRTAGEVQALPHPLARSAAYEHLPLIDPAAEARRAPGEEASLAAAYCSSTTRNTATIAAVMTALAQAPVGPVMFCCAHGRDRTGMVAAMLLELAGVTREAIAADYLVGDVDRRPPAYARYGWTITAMLEHLETTHGSTAGYLRALGIGEDDVARLRARLRAA